MSIRDQERRQQRAMRRADQVGRKIQAKEKQVDKRADEVMRRIDHGDVTPRGLPSKGEDFISPVGNVGEIESVDDVTSL